MLQEEIKTFPIGDVWDEFCARTNAPVGTAWHDEIREYEKTVLVNR